MSDSEDDNHRPVYRSVMAPPPPSRQPSSEGAALFGLGADHILNLTPSNPTHGGGPWWGLAGSTKTTQPTAHRSGDDTADAPFLSRNGTREGQPGTFFPPMPVSNDMMFHMGSDAPLRPTRARTTPPSLRSPLYSPTKSPPHERVTDADVEVLADEWARMKVQAEEMRSNLATSMQAMQQLAANNDSILQDLRSGDFRGGSSASPLSAEAKSTFLEPRRHVSEQSTVMVVMSDHSDEEGEEAQEENEGGAIVVQSVDSDSDDDDLHDPHAVLYRGGEASPDIPLRSRSCLSTSSCPSDASAQASPARGYSWPQAGDVSAACGKRSRSFVSQLAAQPLHPSKQRSQPSSLRTTSPLPEAKAEVEMARIEELKALISAEKAELAQLMSAYKENEIALSQLREINKNLIEEVQRVRQTAAACGAAENHSRGGEVFGHESSDQVTSAVAMATH
uniref:Uncharacterized protein n=1 Tax=Haptolina brevifila TaxID=156173 RepID=A0A7S2J933_9EUKA|mmetsp:Transcript_78652/g.156369  ORF Transcript_78652/g.156369 Transcript_78652/m.156369 type:complete len:449 (+) Transcript_78652:63-1409(+)|eukprot:CAMPEP_0174736300 /NCGR_PEP_ID=MMETSP1094-20130205/66430_1 /TAXON_ID=156173 /ORGANISM="Chrysochromulina brevifilum, Strain UTEX LB 985" /LENGTH=448 /DNA_ID=CAMNT_0015939373 /DNA_START=63 /DNA_END=1409 /DNA_ORIENTATION=-